MVQLAQTRTPVACWSTTGSMLTGVAHMKKYTTEQQAIAFWSKVAITADDNQCWIWLGGKIKGGYGVWDWNGKTTTTHKIAWLYPNYTIPNGMQILHSCDNPSCCNPKHLRIGTHQDNMDDRSQRNRTAKHEKNGNRKLSLPIANDIRNAYKNGEKNVSKLSREFGVSRRQIDRIIDGVHWV